MKTQTATKKHSMLLFSALASLLLVTAACQKSGGGNNNAAPPPVAVTPDCAVQPCTGGGANLYGGTTQTSIQGIQAQFQVTGDQSGNGMASISGQVIFTIPFVCQLGSANLSGPFMIQMSQQGYLQSDVFDGMVMLTGPQGSIPARINVVPTRTQSAGLFTLVLSQCRDFYNMTPVIPINF